MSCDLYCYRSYLGKPEEEEANSVIEIDMDKWAKKERNAASKLAIVQALTAYNSQLEAFDFDYSKGGLALRITVYDNHVFLTVPYWYQDQKARELFEDIKHILT